MAHSPLVTSSSTVTVTWRMHSPSIATIVSVRRSTISCFCGCREDALDDLDLDERHVVSSLVDGVVVRPSSVRAAPAHIGHFP